MIGEINNLFGKLMPSVHSYLCTHHVCILLRAFIGTPFDINDQTKSIDIEKEGTK